MRRVLTAERMRSADKAAGAHFGMPASVLMENAGRFLAEAARELGHPHARHVVVCGPGNNGGDGLVAARFLHAWGLRVTLVLVGERAKLTPEARRNLHALPSRVQPEPPGPVEVRPGDVVVDALFGTGLTRAPEGPFAEAIEHMRRWRSAGAKVVAADLPSGLHTDTGVPFEPCVEADVTVTFGFLKRGQVLEPGATLCGDTRCVDIGIPPEAIEAASDEEGELWLVEEADARGAIAPRRSDTHKGTYGHVLVVAGSHGKSGAAALSATAALRSGAGLVTVATRSAIVESVLGHTPELMGWPLDEKGPLGMGDLDSLRAAAKDKSVLVIGPGIPRGQETVKLLSELLSGVEVPAVLDADALNAVATDLSVLSRAKGPLVLTPHPGEMSRLANLPTQDLQKSRVEVARTFARTHGVTLVLKGARTLIAHHDGTVYVNPTGNPGMATGGMGDVLSGIIGALLGQGLKAPEAVWTAVYAHGLAADLAVAENGRLGLIATDVSHGLGRVWTRWSR